MWMLVIVVIILGLAITTYVALRLAPGQIFGLYDEPCGIGETELIRRTSCRSMPSASWRRNGLGGMDGISSWFPRSQRCPPRLSESVS